ncbi:hypothetical protein ACQ4PT_071908 [Festuca glaucescens]
MRRCTYCVEAPDQAPRLHLLLGTGGALAETGVRCARVLREASRSVATMTASGALGEAVADMDAAVRTLQTDIRALPSKLLLLPDDPSLVDASMALLPMALLLVEIATRIKGVVDSVGALASAAGFELLEDGDGHDKFEVPPLENLHCSDASTVANMDVDASQSAPPMNNDKSVSHSHGVCVAITPYNANPRTRRGIVIVERVRRLSPQLVCATVEVQAGEEVVVHRAGSAERDVRVGDTEVSACVSEVLGAAVCAGDMFAEAGVDSAMVVAASAAGAVVGPQLGHTAPAAPSAGEAQEAGHAGGVLEAKGAGVTCAAPACAGMAREEACAADMPQVGREADAVDGAHADDAAHAVVSLGTASTSSSLPSSSPVDTEGI